MNTMSDKGILHTDLFRMEGCILADYKKEGLK
jgi:hypothetical protein